MRKKFTFFLLLSALLFEVKAGFLFDEFGMKTDCHKSYSHAFCVISAAEMAKGLDDIPKSKLLDTSKDSGISLVNTAVDIGLLTGNLMGGGADTALGIGRGFGSSLLLANALMNLGGPMAMSRNQVMAWMPKELAENEEDALKLLNSMILEATKKSFSGFVIEEVPSSDPRYFKRLQLLGKDCGVGDCFLERYDVGGAGAPTSGSAPEWLGGYKAWVFRINRAPFIWDLNTWGKYSIQKYVPSLTANLPKWFFVSVSPAFLDRNVGQKMLLVYNSGKAYAPVFPEIELTTEQPFDAIKK